MKRDVCNLSLVINPNLCLSVRLVLFVFHQASGFTFSSYTMQKKERLENLTDNQLIERYKQSNDKQAVGELFKRYTGFVFATCFKYLKDRDESEDAVMQIFEKLFDTLLRHDIQIFKPWLYTVVKNHCFQLIKSKGNLRLSDNHMQILSAEVMENGESSNPYSEDSLEHTLQHLDGEIENLSKEQRTCIELFYLKELSYKEVADKTGFTLNEVKSYIQNGKRMLKIGMERRKE